MYKNIFRRLKNVGLLCTVVTGLAVSLGAQATTLDRIDNLTAFTSAYSNPGNLFLSEYVPADLPANSPVVVLLHGCWPFDDSYADEVPQVRSVAHGVMNWGGWDKLADTYHFALLVPEQKTANNSQKCFNWALNQAPGSNEPVSIKQGLDYIRAHHSAIKNDQAHTFIAGISAGGYTMAIMLATYPGEFASGGAVGSGPYQPYIYYMPGYCTDWSTDTECGNAVRTASPSFSGTWPRLSIWQGTADSVTAPSYGNDLLRQWKNVTGATTLDTTTSGTVKGFPHDVYKTSGGTDMVEYYTLTDAEHEWPLDLGTGVDQCGVENDHFGNIHICASFYMGLWFGIVHNLTGPPAISGTPPLTKTFSASITNIGLSGAETGYVANYFGTPIIGSSRWEAYSNYQLGIGTESDGAVDRTILSFDTSALSGKTIDRAYLRVSYNNNWTPSGTDLWAGGNVINVDVKTGNFGSSVVRETGDWSAAATASTAATIGQFPDTVYRVGKIGQSTDFSTPGKNAINKTGTTQLRLTFATTPGASLFIHSTGTTSKLVVEYH